LSGDELSEMDCLKTNCRRWVFGDELFVGDELSELNCPDKISMHQIFQLFSNLSLCVRVRKNNKLKLSLYLYPYFYISDILSNWHYFYPNFSLFSCFFCDKCYACLFLLVFTFNPTTSMIRFSSLNCFFSFHYVSFNLFSTHSVIV
jgi:hypothetical protein